MSEDQFLLSVCDQQSLPAEDFHSVNSEQITVLQLLYYVKVVNVNICIFLL